MVYRHHWPDQFTTLSTGACLSSPGPGGKEGEGEVGGGVGEGEVGDVCVCPGDDVMGGGRTGA